MSTLLRPSTRHITRLALLSSSSRIGARAAAGARIHRIAAHTPSSASAYLLPRARLYSTDPTPPPKDEAKKEPEKQEAAKKEGETVDKESETVKATEDKPKEEEPPKLPEGFVLLSEDELKTLEKMKSLTPIGQHGTFDEAITRIRKTGAPEELQVLLRKQASEGLSIRDSMSAVKIAYKLAAHFESQLTQEMFNSNEPKVGGEEEAKEKSEKSQSKGAGSNKTGSNKKKGAKSDPNIKVFDASDFIGWALAAAVFYPAWSIIFPSETRDISWQELRKNYLDKGLVEKLVVIGNRVRVDLNTEATRSMYPDNAAANPGFNFYISIGSIEVFERHLDEAQNELEIPASERIPVTYASESQFGQILMAFGPTLMVMGLIYFASRRAPGGGGGGGGMFGFAKSKAKMYNHETAVQVKFADIAGMDEAKVEIMEFVSFLQQPERFQRLGAKIPRGAILSGPPGTGKTLLAKATAGESGVPFFSVSGSEFVEMFVGVGASRVRDLFAQARKNAPCIVFIDEIDAIGRSRSDGNKGFGGNEEREATLNQILTEMDGFNTAEQVVVLAGTNRPDVLDKALMRPGRFDRQIYIDRPTMTGRADIFKVHLKNIVTNEDMEYLSNRLAALTPGFSGADIANAVNEAALVGALTFPSIYLPVLENA